jgi:hypothetical protein
MGTSFMNNQLQNSSDLVFHSVEDIREAMFKSVEGGEYHPRQKILETSTLPYADYLTIGLALRECFLNPQKHEVLIQRLRPLAGSIIGVLPPGIQSQGLLPKDEALKSESFERKSLDQISDAQLRQWLVDDGSLVYGELTRQELNQYFNELGPMLSSGGHFVDMGSGLGKWSCLPDYIYRLKHARAWKFCPTDTKWHLIVFATCSKWGKTVSIACQRPPMQTKF